LANGGGKPIQKDIYLRDWSIKNELRNRALIYDNGGYETNDYVSGSLSFFCFSLYILKSDCLCEERLGRRGACVHITILCGSVNHLQLLPVIQIRNVVLYTNLCSHLFGVVFGLRLINNQIFHMNATWFMVSRNTIFSVCRSYYYYYNGLQYTRNETIRLQ
jgi:hypothetical protein